MLGVQGDRDPNRRVPIDVVMGVHQAVVTVRTADLYRKDPLVRPDIDPVKADGGFVNDLFYLLSCDLREVVAIGDDDRTQGTRAEAVHRLEGDLLVGGCPAGPNAEL